MKLFDRRKSPNSIAHLNQPVGVGLRHSFELPKAQPEEALGPDKIAQVFQPTQAVFQAPNRNRLIDDVNAKYISALGDLQAAMNTLAQQSDPTSNVELNKVANDKAQAGMQEARRLTLKFDSSPDAVGEAVADFLAEPRARCAASRSIISLPRVS